MCSSTDGSRHDGDALAALEACAETWLDLDADGLAVDELARLITGAEQQVGRIQAAALELVSAFERREGHRRTGHRNVQHFLQDTCRQSPGRAKARAETAQSLGELVDTARALREGDISPDHAAEIVRAREGLDDDPHAEATLLAAARSGDPNQVRRTGRRLSQRADAEAARREARRAYEQRILTLTPDGRGSVFLEGRLHQLGGEKLLTAIDALCAPSGDEDDRSPGQRRADALISLADLSMRGRRLPDDGGEPPQVNVLVPAETIERRAGAPPGTLSWTGPCPPQALEELICEAQLSWLITDPTGIPLHHGRTRRYATCAQRRALRARDGGCRWPGCTARPEWCIAHHAPPWDEDGTTDLDRLAFVCPAHHATIHHGGWTFTLHPDAAVTILSPDGRVVRTETAVEARDRHHHQVGVDRRCAWVSDLAARTRVAASRDGPPSAVREDRGTYRTERAPPCRSGRAPHPTVTRIDGRDRNRHRAEWPSPRSPPRSRRERLNPSPRAPSVARGGRRRRRPRRP